MSGFEHETLNNRLWSDDDEDLDDLGGLSMLTESDEEEDTSSFFEAAFQSKTALKDDPEDLSFSADQVGGL